MTPVELLRDLLRMRTVNPPGDEGPAAALVDAYLTGAGLETQILVSPEGRSNLVARLEGPRDRPALVMLSHSDVVPVEEESWTRDPFGGESADGFVWGRGALDMKGITVMHAVAAAELARSGQTPAREVVVVVVADEEAGGGEGARWLLDEHATRLGFGDGRPPPEVLGEGAYGLTGMLERPVVPIALGEKTAVWFEVIANGDPGHGALPPQQQAPVNLATLVTEISGFGKPRVHPVMREQFSTLTGAASGAAAAVFRALASPAGNAVARAIAPRLRKAGALGLLLSDSVTPTLMAAGYKSNVVPAEARASFDSRLLPDTDVERFVSSIEGRARRHGGRVGRVEQKGRGPVSDRGPLFEVLADVSRELVQGAVPAVTLSPGITDVRFFRARGATGYGWCPLVLTPELLGTIHGHDERVGLEDFARAVAATSEVVRRACT
ncbi:MAG: M20/M25/M40 family metallo-hydrolase [Actinomycetota bacterium]|nr:M20/M25/M40 family metallo-hydrolase [Actinomycetota bacterium]